MGGYGALRFAFAHPELFSAVSAQSAALITESPQKLDAATQTGVPVLNVLGPVFGKPIDAAHWNENSPFALARKNVEGLRKLAIYFNCGQNDDYGFEKGDQVIKALAAIITDVLARHDSDSFNFAGHIGGDDFIAATRPQRSLEIAEEIAARFKARLPVFHGSEDFERGSYTAMNRRGETEDFRLLSLSIGIVSTEVSKMESYPQLASYATEVKKMAKTQTGFAIVRDRRLIK